MAIPSLCNYNKTHSFTEKDMRVLALTFFVLGLLEIIASACILGCFNHSTLEMKVMTGSLLGVGILSFCFGIWRNNLNPPKESVNDNLATTTSSLNPPSEPPHPSITSAENCTLNEFNYNVYFTEKITTIRDAEEIIIGVQKKSAFLYDITTYITNTYQKDAFIIRKKEDLFQIVSHKKVAIICLTRE